MENRFVGVDISKLSFTAAIRANHQFQVKEFKNDLTGCRELLGWLKNEEKKEYHFCMEATGRYSLLLATFLYEQGQYVSVVNPVQIKYFMKSKLTRNKTDAVDAKMIAQFSELLTPIPWQPEPMEITQLRALINRLNIIEKLILQETNRLGEALHSAVIHSIQRLLEHLTEQANQLKEEIRVHVEQYAFLYEKITLLKTIPGLGDKTSQKIVAFLGYFAIYSS